MATDDSRILASAPANSDDWDDETWGAWFRHAERIHGSSNGRARATDQIAELTASREMAISRAVELENENARLRGLLETLTKEWGKEQDAELAYSDSYTGTENASLAYQRGATLERCGDDIRHLLEHGDMPDWYAADDQEEAA